MLRTELNILVIDDVNSMRMQIRELLKGFGFRRVTIAANGYEAAELLESNKFDLIMCDWHMDPPVNGLDLLKHVRKHPLYRNVPFIMITAEGTKERVVDAINAGVDDYLLKPLTMSQIQTKVLGVLVRKQVLS
jgi:two-component system, chemotaxis family, chemotaxis protein CheY